MASLMFYTIFDVLEDCTGTGKLSLTNFKSVTPIHRVVAHDGDC